MALRNAFENLSLDSTSQSIRDRLPNTLDGDGGVKVHVQNPTAGTVVGAGKTLLQAPVDISGQGSGTVTILAAVAGKKIYIVSYSLLVDNACSIRWLSASNNLSGSMSFGLQGGISENGTIQAPLFWTNTAEALRITVGISSGTTTIGGRLVYFTE